MEAIPARISYQGLLLEGGQLVTGSRNMVFRLFNNSDCSGTPVQSVTKNGVGVEDGLFSVALDVNPAHFDGQALWLRVEAGGTALGCDEVLPAPYALFSASSGALQGWPVSSAAPAAGQVLKWDGSAWAPAGDSAHGHFGASWSGSNASTGFTVQNTGAGDGMRALGSTSIGNNWAALYAYNSGSSPGIYASSDGTYAAYFGKPIFTGGCVGCTTAYVARNDGDAALALGDVVAVTGVAAPLAGNTMPLMGVAAVDGTNTAAAIGVVQSRGLLERSEKEGEVLESVNMAPGAAAPGDYVFVVVQGMAQVKVGGDSAVAPGTLLAAGEGGAVTALAAEPAAFTIGRALDEADPETGLVWVLVGGQ
jgi:hypothetical protein